MAGYSPYFEKLFYGPFKEATLGHYVIIEPKADALVTLISIVTCGFDLKRINKENGITFLTKLERFLVTKFTDSVDDLLMLSDKYDFAIVHEKCVEFVSDLKDDPFFQLRLADKYELEEVEVINNSSLL